MYTGRKSKRYRFTLMFALCLSATQILAAGIVDLSVEELLDIPVTLASRRSEALSRAPAAVFVLTNQDIRRSGARTLPDVLRMVPGLQVAHIDANKWAVTARGFQSRYANKLLVLIDGRSVFTPLFSGVFWEAQNLNLEDVAWIEVIRGPGAALWGANAVNGVINVVTKKASETVGTHIEVGGGHEEQRFAALRYGKAVGNNFHVRTYGQHNVRDSFRDPWSKSPANDDWTSSQGGARVDWVPSRSIDVSLEAETYGIDVGQTYEDILTDVNDSIQVRTFNSRSQMRGAHTMARYSFTPSEETEVALRVYYDYTEINDEFVNEKRHTVDFDVQHRFVPYWRHEVIWGAGFRLSSDQNDSNFTVWISPRKRTVGYASAFLHDRVQLIPTLLEFTIGSKIEWNSYTQFEVQPNARLLWTPHRRHTLWAAASRAVSLPNRVYRGGGALKAIIDRKYVEGAEDLPNDALVILRVGGHPDYRSEDLASYEVGYRMLPLNWLSLDVTAFRNIYTHLRSGEPKTDYYIYRLDSPSPPHLIIPYLAQNKVHGSTYGTEIVAELKLQEWWRIRGWYAYLNMDLDARESLDPSGDSAEDDSPRHQYNIRSAVDLPGDITFDITGRYMGVIDSYSVGDNLVSDYFTVDSRLTWRPIEQMEFVLAGRNLVGGPRGEFGDELLSARSTEIERTVYTSIHFKF
jgi:iron complex outermembrane recepter protein